MSRKPIVVYRLWCGRKRYTGWKADLGEIWEIAIEKGLAYAGLNGGRAGLGPLTWIEHGQRKYARSKTVSLGQH